MLKLHAKIDAMWEDEPFVARVSTRTDRESQHPGREVFLASAAETEPPPGFRLYLAPEGAISKRTASPSQRWCNLPASMSFLADGDILRISPFTGDVSVLYRRSSRFNTMLLTEQCNSNCLMCSQPPKIADDSYLVDTYLEAVPLMSRETGELGISGGEPTLLGPRLIDLLTACQAHLPETSLHMLSNGRMFNYLSLCQEIAAVEHHDLMIGIPLYSDIAWRHDFVVQASGAFDQTLRGIMNLARCGVQVELRVVLHRHTVERLADLARFIVRNLPFVEHVALMGLEMMGYVRMNLGSLWIDPVDYQPALTEAVEILDRHRMTVSIYNHQLCTLDDRLWPFCRKSISDWKNEYLPECDGCSVRTECGGFFSSAGIQHSAHIRPVLSEEVC